MGPPNTGQWVEELTVSLEHRIATEPINSRIVSWKTSAGLNAATIRSKSNYPGGLESFLLNKVQCATQVGKVGDATGWLLDAG